MEQQLAKLDTKFAEAATFEMAQPFLRRTPRSFIPSGSSHYLPIDPQASSVKEGS
jgi:hypothetical protein